MIALAGAGCSSATEPSTPAVAVSFVDASGNEPAVTVEAGRLAVRSRGVVDFTCGLQSPGGSAELHGANLTLTLSAQPVAPSCPFAATRYAYDAIVTGLSAGTYRVTIVARYFPDAPPDTLVARRSVHVSSGA